MTNTEPFFGALKMPLQTAIHWTYSDVSLQLSYLMLRRILSALLVLLIASSSLSLAAPLLHVNFVNSNPNYNNSNVYVTFFVAGGANLFQATLNSAAIPLTQGSRMNDSHGNPIYDTHTFYISQPYTLTQLANGIDITAATSVRFYITLGQPLLTAIGDSTPGTGLLTFGEPGPLSGTADPNWNIRWDAMEITYNGDPADYGDIQAINLFGIPLQVQNFTTGTSTPLQTVRTIDTPTSPSVLAQLKALADANIANGSNYTAPAGVPSDWFVTDTTDTNTPFRRLISPATAPPGSPSAIGPYPSFNAYLDHVNTNTITTPISDTVGSTTFNFTIGAQTSGTDAALIVSGTATGGTSIGAGHTLKMIIPPDSAVGTGTANYPLSNAIYGAAYLANPAVVYYLDSGTVTQADFLNDTGGAAVANQIFHDVASGFNFGFVGNATQVTVPGFNGGQPISLNDMGSPGWRAMASAVSTGSMTLAAAHLFMNTGTGGTKYYNQWASIVFGSSATVYGFAYSDLIQPVAMYSTSYNSTAVSSWTVTVLPDPSLSSNTAPAFTSAASATFAIGQPNSFVVTATGAPAPTFSAANLPNWASFAPNTGILSGTPPNATGSPFTINFTASNGNAPDATQNFILTVANLQPYADWIASYGLSGPAADPAATPQNDFTPNQIKYLGDIDPSQAMTPADQSVLAQGGLSSNAGVTSLTLTYRQYALITGLTITAQTSPDLQTWTDLPPSAITQIGTDARDPIMQAKAAASSSVKFIRLKTTLTP